MISTLRSLLTAVLTIVGLGGLIFFLYFYLPFIIAYIQRGAE